MPEGLEAEIWRQELSRTVGRTIIDAWVDDRVAPSSFTDLVTGARITRIRRSGKVVLIDTDGPTIGLHFGMTGRVVVDGEARIEQLEYASGLDLPEWDRLRLFTGKSAPAAVRFNDPRRLGRISIDPDLSHLGTDIFDLDARSLGQSLGMRRVAIKTALLDQKVVAGLGNLCVDEALWWACISPHRLANSLDSDEIKLLAAVTLQRLRIMLQRGGSTRGTLSPEVRRTCPACKRDEQPLRREKIGGRSSVWCPEHQL